MNNKINKNHSILNKVLKKTMMKVVTSYKIK